MPADPRHYPLMRRDPGGGGGGGGGHHGNGALMRLRDRGPGGVPPDRLFCASPTVLEAINDVLHRRGMPTLCVLPDGTIAPTDPLTFRVEYAPSPFVL